MDEEPNPVKDILYGELETFNERDIAKTIADGKISQIIEEITARCITKVISLGENIDENVGVFATSLLHYLLTLSLTPSQRKIEYKNQQLDIIIPDLRTLRTAPENCLIISIVKTASLKQIKNQISEIQKIQPNNGNIWIVTNKSLEVENKIFSVSDGTFVYIIDEISKFLKSKKQTQFKIFKAN